MSEHLGPPLAFILSHDVTVSDLHRVAQYEREVESIRNQLTVFGRVEVISRDRDNPDERLQLEGVSHKRSSWLHRFPKLYSWLVPLVFGGTLRRARGAYYHHYVSAFGAPLARLLWGSRYCVMCNWMKSEVMRRQGYTFRASLHSILESAIFRYASVITVGSNHLRDTVAKRGGKRALIMDRVHYMDPERFPAKSDYSAGDPFRLAAVGRLVPIKDYPLMIRALALVPGVELHLIGSGKERENLERLADSLGVKAVFHGYVENSELSAQLLEYDAFIMTSHYEGTPKGLMEAMCCGLPSITRDNPAFRDLLDSGCGLLAGSTPETIAAGVSELKQSRELREKLGKAAREHILLHYNRELARQQELEALTRFAELLSSSERKR
jgi:glycosyltransferase involved in cell wall biosynthesis